MQNSKIKIKKKKTKQIREKEIKIKKTFQELQEKSLLKSPERLLMLSPDITVNKECPKCKVSLLSAILCNVEIDYCPECLGLWFEDDELRWAKDEKDKNLKWLDIDIWKEQEKFKISYGIRICPSCRIPLYEVYYGRSGIIIDVCNLCHGVWLDRGEFKKIIDWLKNKGQYEILHNYTKNLFEETIEVFFGPETIREEIVDFLTILKLLKYKFIVNHPVISQIISQLPK